MSLRIRSDMRIPVCMRRALVEKNLTQIQRSCVFIIPGLELELLLPGGELKRRALVRWGQGRRGGLWFTHPLDRADLESMRRFTAPGQGRGAHDGGGTPPPRL